MKGISDLGFDLSCDPRLDEVKDYLSGKEKIDIQDLPRFFLVSDLLYNALRHSLAIPHIKIFRRNLEIMFDSSQLESDGKVSEEIPYLSKQDPSLWALSVISINGQVINFGNTRARFVLGRCSRIILFALGVKLLGIEQVRRILGMDFSFIEKIEVLNNKGVPANMMSNAGAMTLASWIRNVGLEGKTDSEVFDSYDSFIKDLCGETSVKFSNIAFMSERELSKKNHALIYYLRNHKCLPEKNNPEKDVDFYITAGSYEVDCEGFAMFGATIANYGKNVYTPKRVLPRDVCRHTLAMMSICAPHKFWPYKVNLPACGGAEGSLLVIFPSVMSLVLLSPKVDQNNCSVKAFKLVESLSQAYYLNRFEEPSTSACDDSPCLRIKSDCPYQCWVYQAAINNDIFRTVKMVCNDTSVCRANYIGRTVLHEAAAAGHIQIVKLLISACPRLIDVKDKAGQTPMEDAILFGHTGVVKYLENWYVVKTGSPYQRRESSVENKPAV